MGGMFDPVHNGHLAIARTVLERLALDALYLLPCGNPVHREGFYAATEHRLAMLHLALEGDEALHVDDRECRSGDPSYTFNTLRAVQRDHPGCRLYYVMGADAFASLPSWYRWRDLFAQAHLVVAARPGHEQDLDPVLAAELAARSVATPAELKARDSGGILTTRFEWLDVSSSQVRERLRRGAAIDDLVPEQVAHYIHTNRLYTPEAAS